MRLLPVLDLLNGVVVRGIAGRRDAYRPVQSRIVESAAPLAVARAFRDQFGLETLYIADLDAILHAQPNLDIYGRLAADGFTLWIDAGIQDIPAAEAVFRAGADSVIAGLESTPSPALLRDLVRYFGSDRILFSLDLKQGQPLTTGPGWGGLYVPQRGRFDCESLPPIAGRSLAPVKGISPEPIDIINKLLECGLRRLIVLDLAQVGMELGVSTLPLCRDIQRLAKAADVLLELITGGGVRNLQDLLLLKQSGLSGVLIASVLHNGRLTRNDVEQIREI